MDKPKILIIRRSALGDTIHTLPLAKSLREKFPNAQIDWIVEDKAEKFITNNPLLDKVYVIHKKTGGFAEFKQIIKQIRAQKYDIAIDTQQLLKSGVILGLSGAKRKITLSDGREFSWIFANEIIKTNRKQFDINYHVVKRNLEIAKYLGADEEKIEFTLPNTSENDKNKAKDLLNKIDPNLKSVIISPETTWDNKHWTVDSWRKVIENLSGKVNLVYTGTSDENGLSGKILQGFDGIINLSGKTNLFELEEVFKLANLVISVDSGSAHVAWATGVPAIITLFFATSSKRTAPFGEKYFSIQAETPCSPCMKRKCKNKIINECVPTISPEKVISTVNEILKFDR